MKSGTNKEVEGYLVFHPHPVEDSQAKYFDEVQCFVLEVFLARTASDVGGIWFHMSVGLSSTRWR